MYICVHDHNNLSISSPCINAHVFAMVLPNCSHLYIDGKVGEDVCLGMKLALNDFSIFCCLLQITVLSSWKSHPRSDQCFYMVEFPHIGRKCS